MAFRVSPNTFLATWGCVSYGKCHRPSSKRFPTAGWRRVTRILSLPQKINFIEHNFYTAGFAASI
jgi:hypothetical protein